MDEDNVNEGDATNVNENYVSDYTNCARVGYKLHKFFPLYGYFDVEVVRIMPNVAKSIHVRYYDGGVEDVTRYELDTIAYEGSIGIGEIDFKFIKKIGRDYFLGVVVSILDNEKFVCKFYDGGHNHYSLPQL